MPILTEIPSVPFLSSERSAEIKREIQNALETSFHGGSTVPTPATWLPPIVESKEEDRSTYHDTGSEDLNQDPNKTLNTEMILSWLEKNNPEEFARFQENINNMGFSVLSSNGKNKISPVNGSTASSSTIKFGDAPMQQISIPEPPKPNRIANDTFFLAVARSCSLMLRSKMFRS